MKNGHVTLPAVHTISALAAFLCLSSFLLTAPLHAEWINSARIGGGFARLPAQGGDVSLPSKGGTLRLALLDPKSGFLFGMDGSSYRIDSSEKAGPKKPMEGNSITLIWGAYWQAWSLWVGAGGGQMRIFDRLDAESHDPHRYATNEEELGGSFDVYRAKYGKIEACMLWRRLHPELRWRHLYHLSRIEAWHFELGFKFLDW